MSTIAQARMPSRERRAQVALGAATIERPHDLAVRADALVDLDHALVEQARQHDLAVEERGRFW